MSMIVTIPDCVIVSGPKAGVKESIINRNNGISNLGKEVVVTLETGKQIRGKFRGYTSDNDVNQMLIDGDTIPLSKIRVTRREQVEI